MDAASAYLGGGGCWDGPSGQASNNAFCCCFETNQRDWHQKNAGRGILSNDLVDADEPESSQAKRRDEANEIPKAVVSRSLSS